MQKISNNKKGFSLIELSIVMAIIGILIVGISAGGNLIKSSRLSAARSLTLSSQIATISGMILWVESSSKDSFSNDECVTNLQYSDGVGISRWCNIEPSGFKTRNNLTSSGVIYEEEAINNIPAISTNGTSNIVIGNFSGSAISSPTIIIVFRPLEALDGTAKIIVDAGAGNATCSIGIKSTAVTLDAGTAVDRLTNFSILNSYILMASFNGSTSRVFVNDVNQLGADLDLGTNNLSGLTIGTNQAGVDGLSANVAEIIIFNRSLKASERSDIFNYLSKKYRITVANL
ncbi:MAG: prepilin-type N-terminal cleavage/methylation domain-containing protein [Rickettsiales bacterium]|jgi:prepilin-type N-terminal cleavage/methylation domain-containing protein